MIFFLFYTFSRQLFRMKMKKIKKNESPKKPFFTTDLNNSAQLNLFSKSFALVHVNRKDIRLNLYVYFIYRFWWNEACATSSTSLNVIHICKRRQGKKKKKKANLNP